MYHSQGGMKFTTQIFTFSYLLGFENNEVMGILLDATPCMQPKAQLITDHFLCKSNCTKGGRLFHGENCDAVAVFGQKWPQGQKKTTANKLRPKRHQKRIFPKFLDNI